MVGALQSRNFRLFWLGAFVSNIGSWIQTIALNWLVLQLTSSPLALGLVSFAGTVPILALSLIGGAYVDRADRRQILRVTQSLLLVLAFVLAALTWTGLVRIERYVVVSDAGRLINPTIAEGQIVGGLTQGLGGALLEELVYDADGQLLASSLLDYALPAARHVPMVEMVHLQIPTPLNPLGVKGLGEGGAVGAHAAVANAVADALVPLGIEVRTTPLSPARLARQLLAHQ